MDPQRIVVPINTASRMADRGVPAAISAARLFGCGIELLQCVEDPHEVSVLHRKIDPIRASIRLAAPEVAVRASTIVEPHAPDGIIATIQPGHLAVIATRARIIGFQHYFGSAAETVVAKSGRPVLLVGPAADAEQALKVTSVVVPIDPASPSFQILELGQHWASRLAVPMIIVGVLVGRGDLAKARALIEQGIAPYSLAGSRPEVRVLRAPDPATSICQVDRSALVVMDSHARSGLRRVMMGSVTTEVVRRAERAVLVDVLDAATLLTGAASQREAIQ